MNIALVLTVKNEERLLRTNLLYHHAIGASEIFVYFDNTTDQGSASIADLDFVTINNSVPIAAYQDISFLQKFTSQADEHHTARQCLNTYDALLKCREKKYDWLISIDADELVCTQMKSIVQLPVFFDGIDEMVDVVHLKTLEAMQRKLHYDNVFSEELLFKTTHSYGNRFRNIVKKFYDPFSKTKLHFSYWYGQHMGKGAIRVSSDIIPHNVHKYKMVDGTAPKTVTKGHILHYHAYDVQDFIKKFTNFSKHPDTFLSGQKVNSLKLLLRDVVNRSGMSAEELEHYYKENILFSSKEVEQLQRNKYLGVLKRDPPPLVTVAVVKEVFESKINRS